MIVTVANPVFLYFRVFYNNSAPTSRIAGVVLAQFLRFRGNVLIPFP